MEKNGIIDFSRAANQSLENISQENLKDVGDEIVKNLENTGFAYLKNHGFSKELIHDMFELSEAFFNLSIEVKKNYENKEFTSDGYLGPSKEIFDKSEHDIELRESYNVRRDLTEGFPNEIEGFEGNIQQMIETGSGFFNKILRCLEIGLGHVGGFLATQISPSEDAKSQVMMGELVDGGQYLEASPQYNIKNRDNEWMKADPIPGTILLIVGNMFQKLTSGRLIATPHRVLVPNEERKKKSSRKSIIFFLIPNKDTILKPFDSPETDENSYQTSNEYLNSRYESTLIY